MEVLERYPYHISMGTISNRIKKTAHIEGNDAQHWLDIYLFDSRVYPMGYWGNKTHLKFMTEICQVVDSN